MKDGWQHGCLDYDPGADGDEESWARTVAADGWRAWHATGVGIAVGNRRVRRWTVRRACTRPWSVHTHKEKRATP